jgi:hypothetical protein
VAKDRIAIPIEIAAEVMFQHGRACCVCGSMGNAVQIHHIEEDPSNHLLGNLAVLCLEHHYQTQISGGFARKLGPELVRKHRDDWLPRVQRRRDKADEIAASAMSGEAASVLEPQSEAQWLRPNEVSYQAFVRHLPDALAAAYKAARHLWDSGVSLAMIDGSELVTDTLERLWLGLSNWFPTTHFGSPPAQYIATYLAERRTWHYWPMRKLIRLQLETASLCLRPRRHKRMPSA